MAVSFSFLVVAWPHHLHSWIQASKIKYLRFWHHWLHQWASLEHHQAKSHPEYPPVHRNFHHKFLSLFPGGDNLWTIFHGHSPGPKREAPGFIQLPHDCWLLHGKCRRLGWFGDHTTQKENIPRHDWVLHFKLRSCQVHGSILCEKDVWGSYI